jgi:hypothetical protein
MSTKWDTTEMVQLTKRNAAQGRSGNDVWWNKGFSRIDEWDMERIAKVHEWDMKGFRPGVRVAKIHGARYQRV